MPVPDAPNATADAAGGDGELAAGDFAAWVADMQRALRGQGSTQVPCGSCTACCTSSQFVHIGPDETATLAHIPSGLLFPAPRLPRGHVLLGYDKHGHCPLVRDNGCSIYEHRPKACRTYDCRVFPATGTRVDGPDKARLAEQAQRWRFSFANQADRAKHQAACAAATFLVEHAKELPEGAVPSTAAELAVLALGIHDLFLRVEQPRVPVVEPDMNMVRRRLTSLQRSARPSPGRP
jgi:Fe-S-cluster containining protein